MDQPIHSERLTNAFEWIGKKNTDAAEMELKAGLQEAETMKDKTLEALFYSAWGVLYKLKKDYKAAWRAYEKAEKLLPSDPSLKLILAELLTDHFNQFDTAAKKAEKVLNLANDIPAFKHRALTTLGMITLRKGQKKQAIQYLNESAKDNFEGMVTAKNIDLKLIEALLKKETGYEEIKSYLQKAQSFSVKCGEESFIQIFNHLLSLLP